MSGPWRIAGSSSHKPLLVLLLAALAALPFLSTLNHGFVWDDHDLIERGRSRLENPGETLTRPFALGGKETIYYRPVVAYSFALDHAVWGLNPRGFHLTNLIVYVSSTILLFLLIAEYLPLSAACVAAASFALHPVHVESVAFISGRSDLLSGFFLLGSIWLLKTGSDQPVARRYTHFAAAALLYLLALLSKESAAFLPLLALFVLWLKRADRGARLIAFRAGVPVFAALAIYLPARIHAFRGVEISSVSHFPFDLYPWFLLQAARLLFLPIGILPYYRAPPPSGATTITLLLVLALLSFLLYRLGKRQSTGVTAVVATAWLLLSLIPTLPLFRQTGAIIADRFLYIPSMGLAVLVGCVAAALLSRFAGTSGKALVLAPVVLLAATMGVGSALRARDWQSDQTLFESALRRDPDNAVLNYLLGHAYLEAKNLQLARKPLEDAVRLNPAFLRALADLGEVRRRQGDVAGARSLYRQALALQPADADALFGLGALEMDRGDRIAALGLFQRAAKADPSDGLAYVNIGLIHYQAGNRQEARSSWQKALEASPGNSLALNNLGVLSKQDGDLEAARDYFLRALAIDPAYADARRNLERLERPRPR